MSEVYNNPKYYEIAFDFRDLAKEVDTIEACIERFSRIPVQRLLELACGNCPHLVELASRGYDYTGLDNNPHMLDYSRRKAADAGITAELTTGDLADFSFPEQFDFIYILLGSLQVGSNEELRRHFDSVAVALKPGGLYFLDWCIQFESVPENDEGISWEMSRDGIIVKTHVGWKPMNLALQKFEETIRLEIDDHGARHTLQHQHVTRAIYPQEFLLFIEARPDFEFVGWWNLWDLEQPLEQARKVSRPITVIRRTKI